MATAQKVPGVIRAISSSRNRRPWKQGGGGSGWVGKRKKEQNETYRTKKSCLVQYYVQCVWETSTFLDCGVRPVRVQGSRGKLG